MAAGGDAEGFCGRGKGGGVTLLHQYFGFPLRLFAPLNLPSNAAPTDTSTKTPHGPIIRSLPGGK